MEKENLFGNAKRFIIQILLLSVILNIALVVVFFYFFIKENPIPIVFTYKPSIGISEKLLTNNEVISNFESFPSDKLFSLLLDSRHIEEGIRTRDLALSILVQRDHFDINRSLGGKQSPSRFLKRDKNSDQKIPLFSDLSDLEYKQIYEFAVSERWPFTFERLFPIIKEKGDKADPALLQMFFQSDECFAVERLFSNSPMPLQKKILLSLLREGSFESLHTFAENQKIAFDISHNKRREFLLNYLKEGSPTAALLLLYTDMSYAIKNIDDETAICLLKLLPEKSEKGSLLAAHFLNSPRKDEVKKEAEAFLSHDKELAKKFYNRPSAGELRPTFRDIAPISHAPNEHIVQPGESLWSIARKYHITVDDLVKINHLTTTNISTGKMLKITP